ncbi:MAG: hypothetical protein WBD90_16415 [Xanthobacteraceae bacterium]|jgi:hypothetical protein
MARLPVRAVAKATVAIYSVKRSLDVVKRGVNDKLDWAGLFGAGG